ncbi:MAG TPA: phosphate signaling complex protein PhoU, partial [Polyangiales bacterium]|nr:phosphate signaling complex protein PhoU [Polyangiales bacterium]
MPITRGHTDREYEEQLQSLRERLLKMAGVVEQMIVDAVRATLEANKDLARDTIERDHTVNRLEVESDELCLLILAKRQPLASDLRFVTLSLKMVTDLERIGDLAVNICERAIDLPDTPQAWPWEKVERMSRAVRAMIHDAIQAFVDRDVDKAQSVHKRDDEVDQLYWDIFREVLDVMRRQPNMMHEGIHVQSIAKFLE